MITAPAQPSSSPGYVSSGADFRPETIPGCVCSLDARNVLKDGSNLVSQITDLSPVGTNHATQATDAQKPTYVAPAGGLPYLNCGSVTYSKMTLPSLAALTAGECFFVGKASADPAQGNGGIFELGAQQEQFGLNGNVYSGFGTGILKQVSNCGAGMVTGGKASSTFVFNPYSKAGDWGCYLNGSLLGSTSTNTVAFTLSYLFSGISAGVVYYVGQWRRFLLYNRKLTPTERWIVTDYLRRTEGIH